MRVLVEVKKKEGESFESLLRRFNRKIQQSGVLVRARKIRFYTPIKSKNLQRESALRRQQAREKREELKRLGKFVPTSSRRRY
ncbi:MAG: 30S ribosomal protein S21 [Candidatus Doudnabacteria bacterium]|nr:30S ribosomal protein S21 [Candidatus Doudnabacteria bacterium]